MSPAQPIRLAAASVLVAALSAPTHAAESYDNCAGTIESLPAILSTQGIWCLKKDLSTNMTSGDAIAVQANNVTIDCNGFKLGGLAAGAGSTTNGIRNSDRANTTVRNCNIRGFHTGIRTSSILGGHLVENNRLDGNLALGIVIGGDGSTARGNFVLATGGSTVGVTAYGISAILAVQVLDNTIREVFGDPSSSNGDAHGISYSTATGGVIARNNISGVVSGGVGENTGINISGTTGLIVRDNNISGVVTGGPAEDVGIRVHGSSGVVLRDNTISGMDTPWGVGIYCEDDTTSIVGNVVVDMPSKWLNCGDLGQNATD